MAKRKEISLEFDLHSGQKEIYRNAGRFTAVNCGRRFGKTLLSMCLLIEAATRERKPVAYFGPNYKALSEVWKYIKKELENAGLVKSKSEQLKQIEIVGGGLIDFWSMDTGDAGRGRRYCRVVVDEVAMIRNFKDTWQQAIRPTLADFEGDAFLLSTPKGRNNDWFDICNSKKNEWTVFQMPTSKNPYISKSELAAAKKELPPLVYAQEYEAQFVDFQGESFFYEFKEEKHLAEEVLEWDEMHSLWISFDFNHKPCSAIVAQYIEGVGFNFLKSYQVDGGTRALCGVLAPLYRDWPAGVRICGDSSGNAHRSSSEKTDFEIIEETFHLSKRDFIRTKKANARHTYSRTLCNEFLFRLDILFDEEGCRDLINDIKIAKPDKNGNLYKNRDQGYEQDLTDCFRYFVSAFFPAGVKDIRTYAEIVGN